MPLPKAKDPPGRIQIQNIRPLLDCGRYPAKACVGDRVEVSADIFRDGHDQLGAALRWKAPGATRWSEAPMVPLGNDGWRGVLEADRCGRWCYRVEAWTDRIASYQDELRRKVDAGQAERELAGELSEGAALLRIATVTVEQALAAEPGDRHGRVWSQTLELDVDRERARFGAWYELFPRSFGGFAGVAKVLPRLAELGFDVVYLAPVHPIGTTNRKGRNNALTAAAGEPGSPWAIGSELGGHDALNPELGTSAEFDALVAAAEAAGLELALDFAIQCSPDHPWLAAHPEWFNRRPDGTLKYAENPPKRYQDIYNVNFDSEDWRGLWEALRAALMHWVERGIKVFRVDNPHTKPVPFWEWLLAEVRRDHPDVVFLAEAFTRPTMMKTLAKAGFSQSYSYFTWKNTKWELTDFMRDLVEWSRFYRPNFFANTPDILHEYLQVGGRPAFEARLVLAATLSPSYGIYSGFEHCENVPVREGSEEYLDSEKYEAKKRSLDGPLLPLAARLNRIRREQPGLQRLENVVFLETESEWLIAYAKDEVIVVVNLDPFAAHEGLAVLPASLNLAPAFTVRDLLRDETYAWRIGRNYVHLEPGQSHVLAVVR